MPNGRPGWLNSANLYNRAANQVNAQYAPTFASYDAQAAQAQADFQAQRAALSAAYSGVGPVVGSLPAIPQQEITDIMTNNLQSVADMFGYALPQGEFDAGTGYLTTLNHAGAELVADAAARQAAWNPSVTRQAGFAQQAGLGALASNLQSTLRGIDSSRAQTMSGISSQVSARLADLRARQEQKAAEAEAKAADEAFARLIQRLVRRALGKGV